ncbi:stefin-2-like [Xenopus laevis]|uniref:Cystatin domain-containing protein n=2 Tax=Xenopus laevis TaxID=8355 RepID=A0A974HXC0_XENLA|nr:stefin-2-like [Xenopus laevis]OCT93620.1 hypothetical protein XELAEV_18011295mg [Xenopus laevis]
MESSLLLGGFSEVQPAANEAEVLEICDKIRPEVEAKIGENFAEFQAIEYRMQVVAGMIYLIKVYTGNGEYLHIEVLSNLEGGGLELLKYERGKSRDDLLRP